MQMQIVSCGLGLPSRLRVDAGIENNYICSYMILLRGADRGSAIRGKSTHNCRIERLWVDPFRRATNPLRTLLEQLEKDRLLS